MQYYDYAKGKKFVIISYKVKRVTETEKKVFKFKKFLLTKVSRYDIIRYKEKQVQ